MSVVFYISAVVAIVATILVITRTNAMHALLYLIVSLLAVALMFFTLGAPFVAALEVIVYAGAIMVLFIFAVMLLNLGSQTVAEEQLWLQTTAWVGPSVLAFILLVALVAILMSSPHGVGPGIVVDPQQVGASLFGPYLLGVELASQLLLASLVGAYHIGHRFQESSSSVVKAEKARNSAQLQKDQSPIPEGSVEKEGVH